MKHFIPFLLFLASCGLDGPGLDLTVLHEEGTDYRYTRDDVRDVFYAMMIHLSPLETRRIIVTFWADAWQKTEDGEEVWIAGTYTEGLEQIDVWAASKCVANTALPHEILHVWLRQKTGDSDGEHEDPEWDNLRTTYRPELIDWLCE